jgi:hypothetical protein
LAKGSTRSRCTFQPRSTSPGQTSVINPPQDFGVPVRADNITCLRLPLRQAIYGDLTCPTSCPAYGVSAKRALSTRCPTAPDGAFIPLLPSALQSWSRNGGSNQTKPGLRTKSMITDTKQTRAPTSGEHHAMKPMPVATASVSLPTPPKPQVVPSQAAIAEKAYELWCSLGRVIGRDQENWYEAEQQLRQV